MNLSMRLTIIASAVAAVIPAIGPVAAPVASASEESTQDLGADVQYLVQHFDVSVEEAMERLSVQDAVPALVSLALDRYPNEFAGLWIDHEIGGRVVVGWVGEAGAAASDLAADFPFPERLDVADGRSFSYRSLIDTLFEIDSLRDQWRSDRTDSFGFRLNTEGNRVEIVFDASTSVDDRLFFETELNRRFDAGSLQFLTESYRHHEDACDPFKCDPPLRGGIQINNLTAGGNCTLGFVAANVPAPPATTFYALTAGHCADPADVYRQKVSSGTYRTIGATIQSINAGWVDAASILVAPSGAPLNAAGPAFWSPSRWVYHDVFAQSLQIRNKIVQPAAAAPGIFVCRSGYASNAQCGPIVRTFASPNPVLTFIGFDNSMLLETDLCSAPGDSGGPVYTRFNESGIPAGTAFAVHSSSSVQATCHSNETSYHSHVSFVESQLGVFIWCDQVCGPVS